MSFLSNKIRALYILILLFVIYYLVFIKLIENSEELKIDFQEKLKATNDFLSYKCNLMRYIEKMWYLCEDKDLRLKINNCIVITFGEILGFDVLAKTQWKCRVESLHINSKFSEIVGNKSFNFKEL